MCWFCSKTKWSVISEWYWGYQKPSSLTCWHCFVYRTITTKHPTKTKKIVGHEKKSYIQVSSLLVCPGVICARAVKEKRSKQYFCTACNKLTSMCTYNVGEETFSSILRPFLWISKTFNLDQFQRISNWFG